MESSEIARTSAPAYQRWFKAILANKSHAFILLFLLVLSSISFYTTYDGLIRFSYGSLAETPTVFIIVLFMFVLVLQGMLLFSLYELLHSPSLLKVLWLIVYVVTMGVSVFFSYSFYYNLFRADSYAYDNFSVQLNQIKNSALNYQDAFLQIRDGTEELADYSRRRAEEERRRGGTCGYQSPPKPGPRSRYRDSEEKIFTTLSVNISELYDDASADVRKLEGLVKSYSKETSTLKIQNEMNKIVQRINGYRSNGKILNLVSTLRDHMYERRKTDEKDTSGFPITCPDENIDFKGTAIIKQIEALPTVNAVKLFNPESDREVLSRALTVFMQIPRALLPDSFINALFPAKSAESGAATEIIGLDYSPLVLGGLIDLFIFIVGLADGMNSRKHLGLRNFRGRFVSADDIESLGQIANEYMFMGDLRHHIQRSVLGIRLIVPSTPHMLNEHQRGILDLVEALESANMIGKPAKFTLTWDQLTPDIQQSLADVYVDGDSRFYTAYRISAKLWHELQQAYYSWHIDHVPSEWQDTSGNG